MITGENINMELVERNKLDTPTGNLTIKHLVSGIILFSESGAEIQSELWPEPTAITCELVNYSPSLEEL